MFDKVLRGVLSLAAYLATGLAAVAVLRACGVTHAVATELIAQSVGLACGLAMWECTRDERAAERGAEADDTTAAS